MLQCIPQGRGSLQCQWRQKSMPTDKITKFTQLSWRSFPRLSTCSILQKEGLESWQHNAVGHLLNGIGFHLAIRFPPTCTGTISSTEQMTMQLNTSSIFSSHFKLSEKPILRCHRTRINWKVNSGKRGTVKINKWCIITTK